MANYPLTPEGIRAHRKLVIREVAVRRKLLCKAGVKIYCDK